MVRRTDRNCRDGLAVGCHEALLVGCQLIAVHPAAGRLLDHFSELAKRGDLLDGGLPSIASTHRLEDLLYARHPVQMRGLERTLGGRGLGRAEPSR